jgi:excisionase family DNA binding protein
LLNPLKLQIMGNEISAVDFINQLFEAADTLKKMQADIQELKELLTKPAQVDKWLDLDELCDYLPGKPKKQTIYQRVSKNTIPHHNINGKRLSFLKSEVDQWLKSQKRRGKCQR